MIEQLSLTNFKAFRSAEIRLAPVTLLTGLNSSGKSTVLQSLALLRQSYDSGILRSTDGDTDVRGGLLLNGELVELGVGQDVLHEDFVGHGDEPDPFITIEFLAVDQASRVWSARYAPELDVLPLRHSSTGSEESADLPLFSRRFQYLKADRIVPATLYPRSHHQAIGRGFLGSRGSTPSISYATTPRTSSRMAHCAIRPPTATHSSPTSEHGCRSSAPASVWKRPRSLESTPSA